MSATSNFFFISNSPYNEFEQCRVNVGVCTDWSGPNSALLYEHPDLPRILFRHLARLPTRAYLVLFAAYRATIFWVPPRRHSEFAVSSMPSVVHLLLTLLLMNNLDEYPQDLLDALIREAFLERPLIPRHRFEWERLHLPSYSVFRFHREDVIRLAVALRLPAVISTGHEDFKSWEGLLISLHYFASTVYFRAFGSSIIAHTHRNGRLAVHKMGFPAEPPRPLHAACSCKSMARVCCCR
eukprot:g73105.t1